LAIWFGLGVCGEREREREDSSRAIIIIEQLELVSLFEIHIDCVYLISFLIQQISPLLL
jgi:hypothetical protein